MSEPESDEFCCALGNLGSGYNTSKFGSNNKETKRRCYLISLRPKGDHVFIYLEGAHQSLVYTHHPPGVVELSAVVGSGEQRDQLSLGEKLITILHDLWQTSSQKILIFRIKVSDDMLWKVKGFTSD